MSENKWLEDAVHKLTDVAAKWLPRDHAEELVRNVVGAAHLGALGGIGVLATTVRMARQRCDHFGLPLRKEDIPSLAQELALAWISL